MNKCTLNKLNAGERGNIYSLTAKGPMRRRFQDIGLIEGAQVECICKSPMGDPAAYCIRGAIIAIRNDDSKDILITR